jgi:uncharacterized protein YjaZ
MILAMRLMAVIWVTVLVTAGCGGASPRNLEGKAFTVNVSAEAQSAAHHAGTDLRALVIGSANKALSLLPHRGRIAITVRVNPAVVIPEIGIGGYTDPRGDVHLAVDPDRLDFNKALATWIPPTLAHELDHSSRIRTGPGPGPTLGQNMVSEGLADHFVYEVFPHTPPQPWDHALTKADEHALWLQARPLLNRRGGYSYTDWFIGGAEEPRWTGYTLGYDIVGQYLTDQHLSPSKAVSLPALKVLAPFHCC